jgi:hypothetical protein
MVTHFWLDFQPMIGAQRPASLFAHPSQANPA